MSTWNPWRGCQKCSEGCRFCYIHKGDAKRKMDTRQIVQTKQFDYPIRKKKNGDYYCPSGLVYVCFSSDFLIEQADIWRQECWKMIKERQDCTFLFLTKRIDRFMKCIPEDWNDGYDNVVVGCSVEHQRNVDYKLSILKALPIKHKCIICQPLLEDVNLEKYLDNIELVIVGGESDANARLFDYDWALHIRNQCIQHNVSFELRQCGTYTKKDGKIYRIPANQLSRQAKKANINITRIKEE